MAALGLSKSCGNGRFNVSMDVTRQQAAQQAVSFYQELLLKNLDALRGLPVWQCPEGVVWEDDIPYPNPDEPSGDEEEEEEG